MKVKLLPILQDISNYLMILFVLYIVYYLFVLLIERRRREHLLNLHKKRNSVQRLGDRIQSIQKFYDEVDEFMKAKGKPNISDLVFYGVVGFSVIIAVGMLLTGQFVLAILYPLAFIWFFRKIMKVSKKNPIVEMEETLPTAIDHMLRVFSKYSDIKTIIYETSLMISGPLKEELYLMSRQMNTRNPVNVLEDFSEKYDSVWLNNFGFTLLGYLGDSTKDETVRNLRHLRNILEDENKTKKDAISQRKPSLMINYALVVVAIFFGVANIIFNPKGFDFFFHSYLGLFCFTAGCASILGTIYMNIKMMKIDK
mgnify:CR=1 FL=1